MAKQTAGGVLGTGWGQAPRGSPAPAQQAEPAWGSSGRNRSRAESFSAFCSQTVRFFFSFLEGKHLTTKNNTILNFRAFPFSKRFTPLTYFILTTRPYLSREGT